MSAHALAERFLPNIPMLILAAFQPLADVGTCLGGGLLTLAQIPLADFGTLLGSFLPAFQPLADAGTCLAERFLPSCPISPCQFWHGAYYEKVSMADP